MFLLNVYILCGKCLTYELCGYTIQCGILTLCCESSLGNDVLWVYDIKRNKKCVRGMSCFPDVYELELAELVEYYVVHVSKRKRIISPQTRYVCYVSNKLKSAVKKLGNNGKPRRRRAEF